MKRRIRIRIIRIIRIRIITNNKGGLREVNIKREKISLKVERLFYTQKVIGSSPIFSKEKKREKV